MIKGIIFAAVLIAAPSLAQEDPATETPQPPEPGREHLIYNVAVKPDSMFVISDCEGAEGNAGEWVYDVSLTAPDRTVRTGTPRYPAR